jgi:mono/diheme cytochrome c family protein
MLYRTHDPYSAIFAPNATPETVRAGRELFNRQCSACHGVDAKEGMAPNLTKGEFRHEASDWGIYRTITYGIPGTPMQPQKLENVWNLTTFLKDSVAQNRAITAAADPAGTVVPQLNVTFEQIKGAASIPADWLTYRGGMTASGTASLRKSRERS